MTTIIVDTNVWITSAGRSAMSAACAQTALGFVVALQNNDDYLAVDTHWRIMGEYYTNLNPQDVAYEILNLLQNTNRVDWIYIEFDAQGYALVPPTCAIHDLNDRKFVAVALAYPAHPPIYNASDADWLEDEAELVTCGTSVMHLCETELRQKLQTKK